MVVMPSLHPPLPRNTKRAKPTRGLLRTMRALPVQAVAAVTPMPMSLSPRLRFTAEASPGPRLIVSWLHHVVASTPLPLVRISHHQKGVEGVLEMPGPSGSGYWQRDSA